MYFPFLTKEEEDVLKYIVDCVKNGLPRNQNGIDHINSFIKKNKKEKIFNLLEIKEYITYYGYPTKTGFLYFETKNATRERVTRERVWTFIITLVSTIAGGIVLSKILFL